MRFNTYMNSILALFCLILPTKAVSYSKLETLRGTAQACANEIGDNIQTKTYRYMVRKKAPDGSFKTAQAKTMWIGLNKTDPSKLKIGIFHDRNGEADELYEFDLRENSPDLNNSLVNFKSKNRVETCLIASPTDQCAKAISQRREKWTSINARLVQEPEENMKPFDCLLNTIKEVDRVANPDVENQISDS